MTWKADATTDLMYGPGASVRIARVDDKAMHKSPAHRMQKEAKDGIRRAH